MRNTKLKSVCSIQMGYSFRSRMSKKADGLLLIQLKDVESDGTVNINGLSRVAEEGFKETHLVGSGDVVFRSRGFMFKAAVVPEISETLVLAAPLMHLRANCSEILPQYLCWYINQQKCQTYFDSIAEGSAIKMISKAVLSEMPLELPTIEEQEIVIELVELQKHEAHLFKEIMQKREKLIHTRIMQLFEEV